MEQQTDRPLPAQVRAALIKRNKREMKEHGAVKPFRHFKSEPRKTPHLYDETLSVKNWRTVDKTKYGAFINPHNARFIEQFIERLLLNTVKDARTGNLDEMIERSERISEGIDLSSLREDVERN